MTKSSTISFRVFSPSKLVALILILALGINSVHSQNILDKTTIGPLTLENYEEVKSLLKSFGDFIRENQNQKSKIETSLNTPQKEKLNFLAQKDESWSNLEHKDNIICRSCLTFHNSIKSLVLKKYGWSILFDLVSFLCSFGLEKKICKNYISAYGDIVLSSVIEHYFSGEFICTKTHLCATSHFLKLNPDDYAKTLLESKPKHSPVPIDTSADIWKVLHISDIHVDLQYSVGSRGMCPLQLCCRGDSVNYSENNTTIAGKFGFVGKCDLPMITLESFGEKAFKELRPDFVLWTGDNPGHDAYDNSALEVAKIFTKMINEKYNYTMPVYPALGNHEIFPAGEYDPFTGEDKFLASFADVFSQWLDEDTIKTFKKFGGYTKMHLDTNLRIVSFNCMMCDVLNFNLIRDPTDPQSQIEWMEDTLRKAESNKEVVYLVSHIPPGDVSFLSECAKRYKALIDRFSHIIRGQFYGHTHFDEVKIMSEYFDKSKISGVSFIAPSLTTYSNLNPSFRMFEIDSNTKQVRDYLQYSLNITKANLEDKASWEVVYRATEHLKVEFLNDYEGISKTVGRILQDSATFDRLLRSFFSNGPMYADYRNLKKMPLYLSCRFSFDNFADYSKCAGFSTWDSEEYSYKLLNFLTGYWYNKVEY